MGCNFIKINNRLINLSHINQIVKYDKNAKSYDYDKYGSSKLYTIGAVFNINSKDEQNYQTLVHFERLEDRDKYFDELCSILTEKEVK